MKYLMYSPNHPLLMGDTFTELVTGVISFDKKKRTLYVKGCKYNSYTDEWSDAELVTETARDAAKILCNNFGYTLCLEKEI